MSATHGTGQSAKCLIFSLALWELLPLVVAKWPIAQAGLGHE